ncbi:UNKNOWN [Stylonychia lemnae]|uniref:Uncharacterized protein n=1 Tax=Stylonychia lemnae TaxID=5949 RepID=A0A077ZU13_STYLE|nr:UNKNOWN [Stylonychia lemnae]|eukprot:CDW73388.1 UNKNOWN [Stylonychia lemnae]
MIRESNDFQQTGRLMLAAQDDDYSLYDSLNPRDEKVNLVQESFPNYAKIDHFAMEAQQRSMNEERMRRQLQQQQQKQDQDIQQQQQFHEELRNLREQLQREYDEKLKASLNELEQYKLQLQETIQDTDSKQINQFQKQLNDKDKIIYQLNGEKMDLENQLQQNQRQLQIKEEEIINQRSEIDQARFEAEKISQQFNQSKQKEDLIRDYTENLKIQNDQLRQQMFDMNEKFGDMQKQDWSKQLIESKKECDFLREEISQKVKEMNDIKNNLSLAIQQTHVGNASNHFTNLLETQSRDIRQKDQYQGLVAQIERKLIEANQRLAYVQQTDDKRAAAEYLVEQLRVQTDEKQSIIFENQNLYLAYQELQDEHQRILRECKDFLALRQGQISSMDPSLQNQQKLLIRIEELEDLIVDLKHQQSPSEIIDLKQHLTNKELEVNRLQNQITELRKKRMQFPQLFEGNEFHDQFQKQLNEKTQQIQILKREINSFKSQDFMQKINVPSHKSNNLAGDNQLFRPVQSQDQNNGNSWFEEKDRWMVQKLDRNQDVIGSINENFQRNQNNIY